MTPHLTSPGLLTIKASVLTETLSVPSTASHSLRKMMFKSLLLLSVACILDPATAGFSALKAKHFLQVKEVLMTVCNTDKVPGLCWEEVQTCVHKHEAIMKEADFPEPTKEVFDSVDIDSDGTVTEIEWKKFVAQYE